MRNLAKFVHVRKFGLVELWLLSKAPGPINLLPPFLGIASSHSKHSCTPLGEVVMYQRHSSANHKRGEKCAPKWPSPCTSDRSYMLQVAQVHLHHWLLAPACRQWPLLTCPRPVMPTRSFPGQIPKMVPTAKLVSTMDEPSRGSKATEKPSPPMSTGSGTSSLQAYFTTCCRCTVCHRSK